MSGMRVCATHQGRFFTFEKAEQTSNFELFSRIGLEFVSFILHADQDKLKNSIIDNFQLTFAVEHIEINNIVS